MELIAGGRMAEVYEWPGGRVVKLDRPDWNGCGALEADVLVRIAAAGVPAPRVHETVTVDDRFGIVLDRVDGPMLAAVLERDGADLDALAATWTDLHVALNARVVDGLPDLRDGLASSVATSGLEPAVVDDLLGLLDRVDDGRRSLCHFDLHPGNVIVGADGWVVIDWITASTGPPTADFVRTLVLRPPGSATAEGRFVASVLRAGMSARGVDRATVDAWARVVAAARLSEGFSGEYARSLAALATGTRHIDD